jgi:hypothetical protein
MLLVDYLRLSPATPATPVGSQISLTLSNSKDKKAFVKGTTHKLLLTEGLIH